MKLRHSSLFLSDFAPTFTFLLSAPGLAAEAPVAFSDCTKIADNNLRLACLDRLADAVSQPPAEQPAGVLPAMPPPATTAVAEARKNRPGFSLSDHWELDEAHKRGIFKFRPHGANYEPAYQQGCTPARLGVADCRAAKGLYARIYRIWAEPDRL